jgi:hypothetical protein
VAEDRAVRTAGLSAACADTAAAISIAQSHNSRMQTLQPVRHIIAPSCIW